MKDILKYSIWTGIWSLMILPFIVANTMFFPYITGKAFTFRIITAILLGLWLILIIKYKEFRPKASAVLISASAFTLVLLAAALFSIDSSRAFWSNFERMEGWVTMAHLFVYFVIVGSMFDTAKLWLWFFRAQVLIAMILAMISINTGEGVRFSGPLGNPIYISVYFLFILFISLVLLYKDILIRHLSDWRSFKSVLSNSLFYIYLVTSLISLFAVYRTSRGVLLGALGGLIITFILIAILEKERKVLKHISVSILAIIILLVGAFWLAKDTAFVRTNPTLSRLAEISWSNVKGQARQYVWPMAIAGFSERPLIGWGQEGFNYVFNKYYDPRMYGQEPWFDRAHNAPLDFLVAGGSLGLISYLALYLSALYLLWSRQHFDLSEKAMLTGLFSAYFIQSLFVFDNLISYILFFTFLAYVHARSVDGRGHNKIMDRQIGDQYQNYILIPLVVVLTVVIIYFVNIPAIKANKTLIEAMRTIQSGQIISGLEDFKTALSYQSMGRTEIREQLLSYASAISQNKNVADSIKETFVTTAVTEFKKQIAEKPFDARSYILLGNFYNNAGEPKQALPYLLRAAELSPKKQTIRFELIRAQANLGEVEKALELAKETYELEPNFDQAKKVYEAVIEFANNRR